MAKKEVVVISLGGSVIVPDELDINFLKRFKELIFKYKRKYRFAIITGGGKICRKYQAAAKKISKLNADDIDWIGIAASRFNANLIKYVLGVKKPIITNPTKKIKFEGVVVGGGWKPGRSTDYDAVMLAKVLGAKTVINISNIDYLYDKDPRKYKNAKKIFSIDWKDFRKIIGDKWVPGLNKVFDPLAVKLAQKTGLKLILAGNNINNLKNIFDKKSFKGSVVCNYC